VAVPAGRPAARSIAGIEPAINELLPEAREEQSANFSSKTANRDLRVELARGEAIEKTRKMYCAKNTIRQMNRVPQLILFISTLGDPFSEL